jgi:hypothetical protein
MDVDWRDWEALAGDHASQDHFLRTAVRRAAGPEAEAVM